MADIVDQAKLAAGGYKADESKAPWSLLPYDAVGGIVKVLAFGAKKYTPNNWARGMDWNRPYDALMRHMTSWWMGEKVDSDTGYSHLWHAGCNILFLIAYEMRGVGKDNRPNTKPVTQPQPDIFQQMQLGTKCDRNLPYSPPITGKDVFTPWKFPEHDRS